jgi:hypothetical protein
MNVNQFTDEFQRVWKRYTKFNKERKLNLHEILQERAKRATMKKTEIDYLLEDIVKDKEHLGLPMSQVMKMEEVYKKHMKQQKFHKGNLTEIMETHNKSIFDDINRQLSQVNIKRSPQEVIQRRKSLFGLEQIDVEQLKECLSPQLKKSLTKAIVKANELVIKNEIKNTISTRVNTEEDDILKMVEKGCSRKLIRVVEKHKKIKHFVDSIETYEKVLHKSRDESIKKLDEYDNRKYYLRRRYKNVYDENFTTFL